MRTEHGHLAAKRSQRRVWLSCCFVHNERKNKVRGRSPLQRNQGILGPSLHSGRHLVIRRRALVVCSKWDLIVELLEELERDLGYIETADEVPSVECIENLFCDVECIGVLYLAPTFSKQGSECLVFRTYLASEQLIFQVGTKVRELVGRKLLVDWVECLVGIADDLEA